MYDLQGIENGTVNLEQLSLEQLSGILGAAVAQNNGKVVKKVQPVIAKKAAMVSAGNQPVGDKERAMFLNYISKIEDGDLVNKIKNGQARVVRHLLYSVRHIGGSSSIDLFSTARTKVQGLSNMNNAQLDKDNAFLITGFQLRAGVGAGSSDNDAVAVNFIEPGTEILNGHFNFKVGTETFIERCSNTVFRAATNERAGMFMLDTPIMTNPGRDFSFTLDSASNPIANTHARIDIWGLMTMKK